MRKLNLLVISLILMIITASGQTHMIGIKSGKSITNATSLLAESRIGNNFGLTYDVLLKDKFTLGAEFLYSEKGFKQKFSYQSNTLGNNYYFLINYYTDYISLPIKIGYTKGENLKKFIKLGVTPAWLLSSHWTSFTSTEEGGTDGGLEFYSKEYVEGFDLAGLIELGVSYDIDEHINIESSILYNNSLKSYLVDPINNINRHHGVELSLGIKYKI